MGRKKRKRSSRKFYEPLAPGASTRGELLRSLSKKQLKILYLYFRENMGILQITRITHTSLAEVGQIIHGFRVRCQELD